MTTRVEPLIGTESYDDFDRRGTSKEVQWLRLGRGRWRVELGRWAVYVRFGSWCFNCGVGWADE